VHGFYQKHGTGGLEWRQNPRHKETIKNAQDRPYGLESLAKPKFELAVGKGGGKVGGANGDGSVERSKIFAQPL